MTFGLRMNDGIETTTQRPGGVSAMKVRGGTGQNTEWMVTNLTTLRRGAYIFNLVWGPGFATLQKLYKRSHVTLYAS